MLPPLRDVRNRPEVGELLRNKLVRLMTHLDTDVKRVAAEFLFVLCSESGELGGPSPRLSLQSHVSTHTHLFLALQCPGSSSTQAMEMLRASWLPGASWQGAGLRASTQKMKTLTRMNIRKQKPGMWPSSGSLEWVNPQFQS